MPEDFAPPFPVWVMAIKATYDDRGLPSALMLLSDDGRPYKFLPLFTSEQTAGDYIEDHDFDDCVPVRVESPSSFYEWLPGLAERQVNRVRYDISNDPEQLEVGVDLGTFFAGLCRAGGA